VLFVPGLVIFLNLSQHQAEATSLLAIIPVALVGALRQDRYGNVRRRDGLLLGLFSVAGAAGGVAVANVLSGKALQVSFALFTLIVAEELVRKTLRGPPRGPARARRAPVRPGTWGQSPEIWARRQKSSRLEPMGLDNPLHIAFLVVILLLVFGAKRLPEIGRSLGGGMREFKDSISGESKQQPVLTPAAQQPAAQPQQPVAQPPVAQPQPPVAQPVSTPTPQQPASPAPQDESALGPQG
jgi:TatA/E family protein of Tat protein translocase